MSYRGPKKLQSVSCVGAIHGSIDCGCYIECNCSVVLLQKGHCISFELPRTAAKLQASTTTALSRWQAASREGATLDVVVNILQSVLVAVHGTFHVMMAVSSHAKRRWYHFLHQSGQLFIKWDDLKDPAASH